MDDTQLLELAGIAAGEKYGPDRNPLERDDIALRLAVKLGLQITVVRGEKTFVERKDAFAFQDHEGDVDAATRRAIVRAAAELGRKS